MKNKKRVVLSIILLVAVALAVISFLPDKTLKDKKLLKDTKSMVTLQGEYEEKFKTEGYTADKPNIILDPYKSAPLSALILFETDNAVAPEITIKGKDKIQHLNISLKKQRNII